MKNIHSSLPQACSSPEKSVIFLIKTLIHLCRMYFPILINWTSPFPILGLLGVCFFSFLFKFQKKLLYTNSGEPDQTPYFAAADLVLHCLPMSYKNYSRLIWVNCSLPNASLQTVHMVLSLKVNNQNSKIIVCIFP